MNLREIIITEIMSIHDGEDFGKEELEGLEDIELFHLFVSKIRRDAWERGFENGHVVGFNEGNPEDGIIQIELDIPNEDTEEPRNNSEEN